VFFNPGKGILAQGLWSPSKRVLTFLEESLLAALLGSSSSLGKAFIAVAILIILDSPGSFNGAFFSWRVAARQKTSFFT
jgi:hypothetical protein